VLIQACRLVNGVTVVQLPRALVEYWHVELDAHDVILAEGLAAESYLDTGNRTAFTGGGAYLEAHPDFAPKHWTATCLPLVMDGEPIRRAKAGLLARVARWGYGIVEDADLHILADRRRIEPTWLSSQQASFRLPASCERIELRCRGFIPAQVHAASADPRELGICVERLHVDDREVALADPQAFPDGWHAFERNEHGRQWRWTRPGARLPAGIRDVSIDLGSRGYYSSGPTLAVATTA
jgi:hypothetical protein